MSSAPRCKATTQGFYKCGNLARLGSEFCGVHDPARLAAIRDRNREARRDRAAAAERTRAEYWERHKRQTDTLLRLVLEAEVAVDAHELPGLAKALRDYREARS